MVKLKDPANEVLIRIFQLALRRTIYQCLSVCKAWQTVALQMYYQQVFLNSKMVKSLTTILSQKNDEERKSHVITHDNLVKCFQLNQQYGGSLLTQGEFSALISFVPYIKTIEFSHTSNTSNYLKYLNNILEERSRNSIGEEDSIRPLGHVEEIRWERYNYVAEDTMKDIFKACYALRDSLTHLYLRHVDTRFTAANSQIGTYVEFLPHFKCLTHLTIENKDSSNHGTFGDPNLSLKSIFTACPNLTSSKLSSSYPVIQQHKKDLAASSADINTATSATATEGDDSINR